MNCTILCVGKKHDPLLQAAINDYELRLRRYLPLSWRIIDGKAADSGSIALQRESETAQLLKEISPQATVVLLDERGGAVTTRQLAAQIEQWQNEAVRELVIVIGGAHGVEEGLRRRAQQVWNMSALTFPHQLVRLILVEQLYRAYSILAGSPYHHD